MFSAYEVRARLVPALICSVPFLAFGYFFLASINSDFTHIVLSQAIGGVGMMAAAYIFLTFVARHVGTWLQDLMFDGGDRFPTTMFLLEQDDTFTEQHKDQIRNKIKDDFEIDLSGHTSDTAQSRRRIGEAVSLIRKKYFGKSGLVLQRNIEFGISKNTAGGAIVALGISVLIVIVSFITHQSGLLSLGLIMTAVYFTLILFGLLAMRSNAKRYAKTLLEDYAYN